MASIKISDLTAKATMDGTEEILINDSGTSKKMTTQPILDAQTAAETAQTAAETAETNASASATSASSSASTATTKAGEASTSATAAASSATSAASAQSAAESARDSALSAYDNFDDRYLGAKASDPTTDNDGDALVAGALYFNTTDEEMKLYTGSAWTAAYVSGSGVLLITNNLSDLGDAATARTNLGVAIGTDVQAYSSVLQNTTASFTTADETKLDGIETGADVTDATNVDAAGAVMNSDTSTASMSFVVDEDTMTSDSATKVPTQQSVKAYVDSQVQSKDALSELSGTLDDIADGTTYVKSTNDYTDAEQTKLSGIETGATADQTAQEIATAIDADATAETTLKSALGLGTAAYTASTAYATAAQGTTADSALQNVSEDTTPQLGGNLQSNGKNISFGDSASPGTDDTLSFGADNDLQIYYNGADSVIKESTAGNFLIQGDNLYLQNSTGTLSYLRGVDGGATDLRYNGSSKLATTSTGVDVTGEITADGIALGDSQKATFGASDDLQIYHDGSHSYIDEQGTGDLQIRGNNLALRNASGEAYIRCTSDDWVKLYHNDVEKLATTSTGISVSGSTYAELKLTDTDDSSYGRIYNSAGVLVIDADKGNGVASSRISFTIDDSEELRLEADGDLHADGDVIAYSTTISDERLKENIQPIDDALAKVKQLKGCTFTYTADGKESAGLIAQDVEKVLPSAVTEKELPLKQDDGKEYKVLQYDQTIGLLVEAIKELSAKVEELENK